MFATRALRIAFLAASVIPSAIAAQTPADLQAAIHARDSAIAAADVATFDRYTADEFTVILPDGTVKTKAIRMAEMKSARPFEFVAPTQQQIRMYGDVAVRQSIWAGGDYWVTDIWVKSGGRWRVVALQMTNAAKK